MSSYAASVRAVAAGKLTSFPIIRNLAVLTLGTVAGQAIAVAGSPFLTRLYDPHAFGQFGIFSAIVVTISAAATLKFEQAIVTEREQRLAVHVFSLCILVAALVALLIPLLVVMARDQVTAWFGPEVTNILLLYGPPSVVVAGLFNALQFWSIRHKNFQVLAAYQILRSGSVIAIQATLAIGVGGAVGLVAGQLMGQILGLLILLVSFHKDFGDAVGNCGALRQIWRRVQVHRQFALYGAPQSVLNAFSGNIPTLLLASLFGTVESGLFWLAYRMLMLPSLILTESLRSILYQRLAEIHHQGGDLLPTLRRSSILLFLACAPVAAVLAVFGPMLFHLVFGAKWEGAGLDARLLAPAWLIQNAVVPFSVVIPILGLQRRYFLLEIVSTVLRAGAIVVGFAFGTQALSLILFAIVGVAASVALIGISWGNVRMSPASPVQDSVGTSG